MRVGSSGEQGGRGLGGQKGGEGGGQKGREGEGGKSRLVLTPHNNNFCDYSRRPENRVFGSSFGVGVLVPDGLASRGRWGREGREKGF